MRRSGRHQLLPSRRRAVAGTGCAGAAPGCAQRRCSRALPSDGGDALMRRAAHIYISMRCSLSATATLEPPDDAHSRTASKSHWIHRMMPIACRTCSRSSVSIRSLRHSSPRTSPEKRGAGGVERFAKRHVLMHPRHELMADTTRLHRPAYDLKAYVASSFLMPRTANSTTTMMVPSSDFPHTALGDTHL